MSEDLHLLAAIANVGGDPLDLPFWRACREGRFLVHRCGVCGRSYWPASLCVQHGDRAMSWVDASGKGTLYTYTVLHHAYTPEMRGKTPYAVGVVKLKEGPFFHSNIVGCGLDEVAVGMPVEVLMSETRDLALPMFRPDRRSAVTTGNDGTGSAL